MTDEERQNAEKIAKKIDGIRENALNLCVTEIADAISSKHQITLSDETMDEIATLVNQAMISFFTIGTTAMIFSK